LAEAIAAADLRITNYRKRRALRGWTACLEAAWHRLIVIALGITWVLDGLEVKRHGT